MKVVTDSVRKTVSLGRKFSKALVCGDVVLLEGPLGVGKTVFIKGIAQGKGVAKDSVVSPSFTLLRQYQAKDACLFHIDLYRIDHPQELVNVGYEEYFYEPGGISLIEWGQRVEDSLSKYIKVRMGFLGEKKRSIAITARGYPRYKLRAIR